MQLPQTSQVHVELKRLTDQEVLKLYDATSNYIKRSLARGKQVASQERYDFVVTNTLQPGLFEGLFTRKVMSARKHAAS